MGRVGCSGIIITLLMRVQDMASVASRADTQVATTVLVVGKGVGRRRGRRQGSC